MFLLETDSLTDKAIYAHDGASNITSAATSAA